MEIFTYNDHTNYIKKYNFNRNRGDDTMMAVFEMIQEENTKIFMNGKKQGKIEGVKEIARKLLSKNLSKKEISEITGLKDEEIENLKK